MTAPQDGSMDDDDDDDNDDFFIIVRKKQAMRFNNATSEIFKRRPVM